MHLEPQNEYDMHEFRNNRQICRSHPLVCTLARIVWDVWGKTRDIGLGLCRAWQQIHSHDARLESIEERLARMEAENARLRIHDESEAA